MTHTAKLGTPRRTVTTGLHIRCERCTEALELLTHWQARALELETALRETNEYLQHHGDGLAVQARLRTNRELLAP